MKNLYVLILFVILLFSCKKTLSQALYLNKTIYVDSTSTPGDKKFHLKLKLGGNYVPMFYCTRNTVTNELYYGDSVPNIANSTSGSSLHSFISYAINSSNLLDTIIQAFFTPNNKNTIKINSISPSTPYYYDGTLSFSLDNTGIVGNNNFFAYGRYEPGSPLNGSLSNSGIITGLAEGKYNIGWYQASPPFNIDSSVIKEAYQFFIGDIYMPETSLFQASVNPYSYANGSSCSGKAKALGLGGQAPYLYSFNNGAFSSTDSITGLCAGIHLVTVLDANQYTVAKNFIITNNSNTYNNPNTNGTVGDTIVLNVANCAIDYNLPIDSGFINSSTFINPNTLAISFVIWQVGNSIVINDTISYPFQNNSNYMISLILYCGSQKMIVSNFNSKRVNDFVYASNLPVKIKEISSSSDLTTVYPNPFTNELSVDVKSTVDVTSIKMVNILGENLNVSFEKQTNGYKLNTDNLGKGIYFIKIVFDTKESKMIKVIKQ